MHNFLRKLGCNRWSWRSWNDLDNWLSCGNSFGLLCWSYLFSWYYSNCWLFNDDWLCSPGWASLSYWCWCNSSSSSSWRSSLIRLIIRDKESSYSHWLQSYSLEPFLVGWAVIERKLRAVIFSSPNAFSSLSSLRFLHICWEWELIDINRLG